LGTHKKKRRELQHGFVSEEKCPMSKNVLLTGPPGVGKTTVLKAVSDVTREGR